MGTLRLCIALFSLLFLKSGLAQEVRIKDLATVKGNRSNSLVGLGLVVGLQGTGDSPASLTTNSAIKNLITRLGIDLSEGQVPTQSTAAVVVTGDLPAFVRNGSKIDVKASVIGDATSLAGGTLIPTRLRAGDGKIYVIASGSIVTGSAIGAGPKVLSSVTIPAGGMVEREFAPNIMNNNKIFLTLNKSDFSTSARISESINKHYKGFYASSIDPLTVELTIPPLFGDRVVDFISEMEGIKVEKDIEAMVIINEKTGTVVLGANVSIMPVVISHGDLSIEVGSEEKPKRESVAHVRGSNIGELLKSLNALGVKPQDLIGIIQAIHAAGALNGTLKIM